MASKKRKSCSNNDEEKNKQKNSGKRRKVTNITKTKYYKFLSSDMKLHGVLYNKGINTVQTEDCKDPIKSGFRNWFTVIPENQIEDYVGDERYLYRVSLPEKREEFQLHIITNPGCNKPISVYTNMFKLKDYCDMYDPDNYDKFKLPNWHIPQILLNLFLANEFPLLEKWVPYIKNNRPELHGTGLYNIAYRCHDDKLEYLNYLHVNELVNYQDLADHHDIQNKIMSMDCDEEISKWLEKNCINVWN